MKKMIAPVAALLILLVSLNGTYAKAQRPDYEKYGRIATAVIKEDFPGEPVKDYQYMGRQQLSDGQVMDSFQFKLTENGKPVVATVQITHDLKDNKLMNLTVTKKAQQ